jgi:hypothetical protein
MLNNMKNASMKMGSGKKGKGFSLSDIIKKQGELSEKMKKGGERAKGLGRKPGNNAIDKKGREKKGEKPGNKGEGGKNNTESNGEGSGEKGVGQNDNLDGELFEIYKQQSQLRQQLQIAIKESEKGDKKNSGQTKRVLKSMEQLENEILENGFSAPTIQKMQQLNYDLLKLDKAALEQGKENIRKATVSRSATNKNNKKLLDFKKHDTITKTSSKSTRKPIEMSFFIVPKNLVFESYDALSYQIEQELQKHTHFLMHICLYLVLYLYLQTLLKANNILFQTGFFVYRNSLSNTHLPVYKSLLPLFLPSLSQECLRLRQHLLEFRLTTHLK